MTPEDQLDMMESEFNLPQGGSDPLLVPSEGKEAETPQQQETEGDVPLQMTEELQKALLYVVNTISRDDDEVRRRMAPFWELYEYYWRGIQDVVYDSNTNSVVSSTDVLRKAEDFDDAYISQKIINIYRAHGESVAAALTTGEPHILFFPEDADRPEDISTAKAFSAAAEYIADDNDSKMLSLQAMYIRWNQPFVAYYNTYVYDEKFGSIVKRDYELQDQAVNTTICPSCGDDLGPGQAPSQDPSVQPPNASSVCQLCGVEGIPDSSIQQIPQVTNEETLPKGREVIEVYGPRHVKVPYNIKKLDQAGYLVLETEHHWAQLIDVYPQLIENVKGGYGSASTGYEQESRYRRTAVEARDYTRDQRTLKRCWLRPWAFNILKDEEEKAQLKTLFPHGVQVTFVDDYFCEAYDESMDDHWTIMPDPFAEHIHGDPLGKVIIPIQDMRNDIAQLTLETILFSIAETFADPEVLNFNEYDTTEKAPGRVLKAVRPSGLGLDAGFFQPKPSQLSDNVEVFRQSLDQDAQFVTKDFPGIFGGPLQKGSSRTAEEYSLAKQSALQALSTTYKVHITAWADVQKKATEELRRNMVYQGEDVKYVKESGSGFKNIFIRLSDVSEGKIGRVRPESSEAFPLTWEQQWQKITELLNIPLPQLQSFLTDPSNIGELKKAIGLRRFKYPGEDDRDKQLWEIHQMLEGVPVPIDPTIDDHQMHAYIIQSWAKSPEGLEAKNMNPQGYQFVMEHLMEHQMIAEQQQQQAMAAASQQATAEQPKPTANSVVRKTS